MNKSAFLIALVTALVGGALCFLYLKRAEQELSGGKKIEILTMVKSVDQGARVTEDNVAVREVPQAYVEDRSVKAAEKSRVVGLRLGHDLRAGQTLMWTDLAIATDERRELSGLIQPGRRAYTVHSRDQSFALVEPGDYVDLLASLNSLEGRKSVVLLQKVLVLAQGLSTLPSDPTDKRRTRNVALTLSVTLPESQLLSLAGAAGSGELVVVLRNPEDPRVAEGIKDMNIKALTNDEERARVQRARAESGPVKLVTQ